MLYIGAMTTAAAEVYQNLQGEALDLSRAR